MADFFSRLADRALESSPRLNVRLPSRFDPVRGGVGDPAADLGSAPVGDPGHPVSSGSGGVFAEPVTSKGLLPPRPAAETTGDGGKPSPETSVITAAHPAAGDDAGSGARSDFRDADAAADPMGHSRRHHSPTARRERAELRKTASPTGENPPADPRVVHEPQSEFDARTRRSSREPVSRPTEPSVGVDDLEALERRLRPLLPRQPVPAPAVQTSVRVGGGERDEGRDTPSPPPAVEVTIGSIEVRAAVPATPPAPSRPGPTFTLDDYLKRRDRGRQ